MMKIMIWGTGFAMQELMETELKGVNIEAYIDNKENKKYETITPEEASGREYDAVIVATRYAKEIYEQARKLGFDLSKFIFVYNNYKFEDLNVNYDLASRIFSPRYINIIQNRYHVVRGMLQDEVSKSIFASGGVFQKAGNRVCIAPITIG